MSVAPFRLGVAGLSHGHVWGLIDKFAALPEVELVALWPGTELLDPKSLEETKSRFGQTASSWSELLELGLDALLVTSNSKESAVIAVQALNRGLHAFVEKPMATVPEDADLMLMAQRASGKVLMINWPICWQKGFREFDRLVAEGVVGQPFHFRFRTGHKGPKEIGCGPEFTSWLYDEELNGGGAIADFGSYGAALARWHLGMPQAVICAAGNYTKPYEISDDHAVILLRYPNASAVLEATWATNGFDSSANPVLHGDKGTIGGFGDEVEIVEGPNRTRHPAPDLPETNPAAYFLNCIRSGSTPEGILDPVIAADAVRIVAAARRSLTSGRFEELL
jgi:predicted dehydrogenase